MSFRYDTLRQRQTHQYALMIADLKAAAAGRISRTPDICDAV